MDDSKFDMAMMFVMLGGGTVWSESTMYVHPSDKLMEGFKAASSYDDYSNFFDVQSFDFTMTVKPDEENVTSMTKAATGGAAPHPAAGAAGAKPAASGFDRWRSATESKYREINFPMEFEAFSFTRIIDGASPIFFQACATQTKFKSAALVKRVSTGIGTGIDQTRTAMAFMRLDFEEITLKSVKWQDGELVTENCTFTCKKMTYRYRQQDPNGTLRPVGKEAVWSRADDASAKRRGDR